MKASTLRTTMAVAVAVVVAAVVVAGFMVMGSPSEARLRRLDERRIGHLRQIARSVALFWTVNDDLPGSLGQLSDVGGVAETPTDPESGKLYRYRVIDSVRYELCAEFAGSTEGRALRPAEKLWSHARGRQCFELAPTETVR